jgi:hypothetical protein
MTSHPADAGPRDEFAREFFRLERRDADRAVRAVVRGEAIPGGFTMSTAIPTPADGTVVVSACGLFLGRWVSTNPRTTGLAEAEFSDGPAGTTMRILGASEGGAPIDWGTTAAALFVDDQAQSAPSKVGASYDFGFMSVLLHGWVKQGVLVLAVFSRFRDDDGRSNHFDREFFFRPPPAPGEGGRLPRDEVVNDE